MVTLNIMSRVVNVIGASYHVMSVNTLSLCDIKWFVVHRTICILCSLEDVQYHWALQGWLVARSIGNRGHMHQSRW